MLELIDSKKHVITAAELAEISDEINSKPDAVVLVRDLQAVERADTETLKVFPNASNSPTRIRLTLGLHLAGR